MDEKIVELKKKWPFKLGTTSFIDPGPILPNVTTLGPLFDEIELLVFESRPFMTAEGPVPVLPAGEEILALERLSREVDVTYNVHLPVDVSMTHPSTAERTRAVETIKQVLTRCAPLDPSTHTLHLEFIDGDVPVTVDEIKRRQEWAVESLEHLSTFMGGIRNISIETLSYPPEYLFPILDALDVSLCIDAGHLIKYGYDILPLFERYGHRVPLMHLHGVDFSHEPPKDHQGLRRTPEDRFLSTLEVLRHFQGVVSLEVFNRAHLQDSVEFLEQVG